MSVYVTQATTATHRRRIGGNSWISIRPIERADAAALADFYAALAPESRRRRFLSAGVPPPSVIDHVSRAPGVVAVLREGGPRDGAVVAHASVQPDGVGGAEVSFAVADAYQHHGIGRLLVGSALRLARELGARRATATMLPDNAAMRRLLRTAGSPVSRDLLDGGTEEIVLDLATAA